jgi:hypothetical protein
MSVVLRGFPSAEYHLVRLNENPCAALLIKKAPHLWIGNLRCVHHLSRYSWMGTKLFDTHFLNCFILFFLLHDEAT